ncbi:MAG TPA: VWA domain-containing protein [Bryobacterales bacterium]|nr:VWA domain-containing protein [Bryobacterales bacterium]
MQIPFERRDDLADSRCSRRQFALAAASLFCAHSLAGGQQEATFSTDVKVVNVLATVVNKKGQIIRDLTKDDFSLSEDGRPQAIRYFARESDLPLTLGLLVDTSMSQRRVLDAERGASFRFLDQVLRETKDQVFLMQFDMAVQMRQPLTSSRNQLEDALSFVDTPTVRELRHQNGGGTLLYDAVVAAAEDVMKSQQGRKALIVLSDGVDIGSEATLAVAIDAAQRADTLVYSILFSDASAYAFSLGSPDGRGALRQISKQTGGGFFEVSKKQSLEQIFSLVQEELRSQYSLGYVSDQPVRISEFRRIQLTAKQKGLVVQARDRYWAKR